MRIAQVSPLYESVPPKLYGGTERVVHYLTEELVALGHDVTLFASGDSVCSGRLVSPCKVATRLDPACVDPLSHHFRLMEMVEKEAKSFDIIHSHIDYLYFPLLRRSRIPNVTTIHGRLDLPEHSELYKEYNDIPLVSISLSQKKPVPYANWQGTVYHGLPPDLYRFNPRKGDYLSFVGRISREKRVDRAISIAIRTGIPIRIAAKIDNTDREYFELKIKKLFNNPLVEYVGEIGEKEKDELLGNSLALLYPVDWPEPFGLAMIEAFACGTPVIAFNNGSVPEIIDHGKTGFIVNSVEQAVRAVKKVHELNRKHCRDVFEERFSARRMASDYLSIYQSQRVHNEKRSHYFIERTELKI